VYVQLVSGNNGNISMLARGVEAGDGDWVTVELATGYADCIGNINGGVFVQAASRYAELNITIANIFIFLTSHRLVSRYRFVRQLVLLFMIAVNSI
jgi:hypothetical protein